MTVTAIKKQVDDYLPMLSSRQQVLVPEMIKGFLNLDDDNAKRITLQRYNEEINTAVTRIENGNSVSHEDALNELSK